MRADITRITALWAETRGRFGSGGPYLFGAKFGIADAFFAPVMTRFRTYGVELEGAPREYASALAQDPHVRDWETKATAETFHEDLNEW